MKQIYAPAILFLCVRLAPLSGLPGTQDGQNILTERVDRLFSGFTQTQSPGLAMAVVRDNAILYSKGYGLASLEHRIPITPSTVFDIASVSKQFTGLSVAMLLDQGKIQLRDDIRKYIPELSEFGRTITVDHLQIGRAS